MRLNAINTQNSKQNFKGNLIGKLPEELNKYSTKFEAYAKKTLATLPNDVILKEGTANEGKYLNANVEFPNCYISTPLMVSEVKSINDLKKYIDGVKSEALEIISAHKKCKFSK